MDDTVKGVGDFVDDCVLVKVVVGVIKSVGVKVCDVEVDLVVVLWAVENFVVGIVPSDLSVCCVVIIVDGGDELFVVKVVATDDEVEDTLLSVIVDGLVVDSKVVVGVFIVEV